MSSKKWWEVKMANTQIQRRQRSLSYKKRAQCLEEGEEPGKSPQEGAIHRTLSAPVSSEWAESSLTGLNKANPD
ncbi:hypothetical protein JZ751_005200 [Albula glossodonta]|uniref:Uncharacterized protein n=1 Tax=Albula glossodonta TaxID=121402 RepID=A0A8T2P5R6_9TELE|nr:hypothetical protein JZ751_005200 [Albula glossodonta]